jgi:hypothetical protein
MKPGDKVIDVSNTLTNDLPMNLTKVEGNIATVEYFDYESEGKHEKIEVHINMLKQV